MATVPVLMYHHVNPNKGDMITVTPEVFEAQMRHVMESGYRTLSLDELVDIMEGRLLLKEKALAITFDDGYLDNFIYAFPVLKKYGIKADIFIVSRWVEPASTKAGRKAAVEEYEKNPPTHKETKTLIEKGFFGKVIMDWDMIREMRDTGLVEFNSHTMSHKRCDQLSKEDLIIELSGSKYEIEQKLKAPCKYLCWPKGHFNKTAVEIARHSGYKGLFTTIPGVVKNGSDPFSIKRVVVKDKVHWFKTRLKIYTNPLFSSFYLRMKKKGI